MTHIEGDVLSAFGPEHEHIDDVQIEEFAPGIWTSIKNIASHCSPRNGWAVCFSVKFDRNGGGTMLHAPANKYLLQGNIRVVWKPGTPDEIKAKYDKPASKD